MGKQVLFCNQAEVTSDQGNLFVLIRDDNVFLTFTSSVIHEVTDVTALFYFCVYVSVEVKYFPY